MFLLWVGSHRGDALIEASGLIPWINLMTIAERNGGDRHSLQKASLIRRICFSRALLYIHTGYLRPNTLPLEKRKGKRKEGSTLTILLHPQPRHLLPTRMLVINHAEVGELVEPRQALRQEARVEARRVPYATWRGWRVVQHCQIDGPVQPPRDLEVCLCCRKACPACADDDYSCRF